MFDTVVARLVGRALPDNALLIARNTDPPTLTEQVRREVALIRSTEIDDIEIVGCVTPGSVIIPVAVLRGAALGCTDEAIMRAILVGYEAMIGLARAIDGAHALSRGVWPTYIAAPFGAAAAMATLLQLEREPLTAALALALARTAPAAGRTSTGVSPRFYLLGCAAAEGVASAEAAAAGFGGDPALLELVARLLGGPLPSLVMEARPAIFSVETKPFPTARQGMAAVEAFRSVTELRGRDGIARVTVDVPTACATMIAVRAVPPNRIGSLVSVACQMALDGHQLFNALRNIELDLAAAALIERIEVRASAELDAAFPRVWGARVRVEFEDGTIEEAELMNPSGSQGRPFGWEEVRHKASVILAASSIDPAPLDPLERACRTLGGGRQSAASIHALAFEAS